MPDPLTAKPTGVRITAIDLANPSATITKDIADDYALITAGRCEETGVDVFHADDGTETHVITIRGIRRER